MLVAVIGALAMAGLGTWQVQRLGWKEGLIAERQASLARPPVAIGDISASPPAWRHVTVTGTFLHANSLPVGPRSWRGLPHWRLVTPLRLSDGGIVLIDRGWVPDRGGKAALSSVARPAGTVTIEGVARTPSSPGRFAPDNDPAGDSWFRVAPAEMARRLALSETAGFWIEATGKQGTGRYPVPEAVIAMPSNNHLQYAITWYGLALAALAVAGAYWRRARRATS